MYPSLVLDPVLEFSFCITKLLFSFVTKEKNNSKSNVTIAKNNSNQSDESKSVSKLLVNTTEDMNSS